MALAWQLWRHCWNIPLALLFLLRLSMMLNPSFAYLFFCIWKVSGMLLAYHHLKENKKDKFVGSTSETRKRHHKATCPCCLLCWQSFLENSPHVLRTVVPKLTMATSFFHNVRPWQQLCEVLHENHMHGQDADARERQGHGGHPVVFLWDCCGAIGCYNAQFGNPSLRELY